MKYLPPYRIENGSIYEYCELARAYVHIYKKSQLTKQEISSIQKQLWAYERAYDAENNKNETN